MPDPFSTPLPLGEHPETQGDPIREREDEIGMLVDRFYTLGRADPVLGPVFEAHVSDWGRHLSTMRDFWSAAIYRTGRYHGRPLEVHARVGEIRPEHFGRWLELWERAVRETVRTGAGEVLVERARRMAESMSSRLEMIRDQCA